MKDIWRVLCIHLGDASGEFRLAVERQRQRVPQKRKDDTTGIRGGVC